MARLAKAPAFMQFIRRVSPQTARLASTETHFVAEDETLKQTDDLAKPLTKRQGKVWGRKKLSSCCIFSSL